MPRPESVRSLTLLCPGALATASLPARFSLRPCWPRGWRRGTLVTHRTDARLVATEMPHEAWLRHRFGLDATLSIEAATAALDEVPMPSIRLTPAHLHTGRDHLLLTDPRALDLRDDEKAALAAAVAPLFDEVGWTLRAVAPLRWYLTPRQAGSVPEVRPDALAHGWRLAAGRNIDAYLSRDPLTRPWRRLMNEVQMTWFDHPVNQAREARGQVALSTLWVEGRIDRPADAALTPYAGHWLLAGADPAWLGLARLFGLASPATPDLDGLAAWLRDRPADRVPTADTVIAMVEDWPVLGPEGDSAGFVEGWRRFGRWLDAAGLADGPAAGFDRLDVVLTGDRSTITVRLTTRDRWRFWHQLDPDAWCERFETDELPAEPREPARPRPDHDPEHPDFHR